MARAAVHSPVKLDSSQTGSSQASGGRRRAPGILSPASAAAPARRPEPRSEPLAASTATAAPAPMTPAPASVDDLVREAQRAWMRGQYPVAIGGARAALKAGPTPAQAVRAYEIIGTCFCAMGEAGGAREAALHLSDTNREMVRAACEKKGVTIE